MLVGLLVGLSPLAFSAFLGVFITAPAQMLKSAFFITAPAHPHATSVAVYPVADTQRYKRLCPFIDPSVSWGLDTPAHLSKQYCDRCEI